MPVKSYPEKPPAEASTQGSGSERLIKREITMPDGRYMIFYSAPATTESATTASATTDRATIDRASTEKPTEKQR